MKGVPEFIVALGMVSTVACAAGWMVAVALSRLGAATRHYIWLLALCAPVAALPVALTHLRVDVPVLKAAAVVESGAGGNGARPMERRGEGPESAMEMGGGKPVMARATAGEIIKGDGVEINWWLAGWALGAGVVAMRGVAGRLQVRRLIARNSVDALPELERIMDETLVMLRMKRAPGLAVARGVEVPFCHGAVRAEVVFPASAEEWSPEKMELCMRHELAHVQRGDLLAMAMGEIAAVLCWFNPLIWMAVRRLRDEAENAADDMVVAGVADPGAYARQLVAMAAETRLAVLWMARPRRLRQRVEAILRPAMRRNAPKLRSRIAVAGIALAVVVSAMAVRLTPAKAAPAAAAEQSGPGSKAGELAGLDVKSPDPFKVEAVDIVVRDVIKAGDTSSMEVLVKSGLDMNSHGDGNGVVGDPFLFTAIVHDKLDMVKWMIAHGADVHCKTHYFTSPAKLAVWLGRKEIADVLIAAGSACEPIFYAAGTGDVAGLEAIQKQDAEESGTGAMTTGTSAVREAKLKKWRDALTYSVTGGKENTFDWLWKAAEITDPALKKKKLSEYYKDCATYGSVGVMKKLAAVGGSVKEYGDVALEWAVIYGETEIARYLLDAGVPANLKLPRFDPMLRTAVGDGPIELVRLLLERGADVNALDSGGDTPLAWAASNGRDDVCVLLLEYGADGQLANERGENAAWYAAGGMHCPQALEAMIAKGVRVSGSSAHEANILQGMMHYVAPKPGEVAYLSKVYTEKETTEYYARERRVVELLAKAGLDVSGTAGSETPLSSAIQEGHVAAAEELLAQGADPRIRNGHGVSALYEALDWGGAYPTMMPLVEKMLDRGCDANEMDTVPGMTPPTRIAMIEECVERYAHDTSQVDGWNAHAFEALVSHGGKFPGVKKEADQALLLAAGRGDTQEMKAALAAGASVNARDGAGFTPLIVAAAMNQFDAAEWLLDHGANAKFFTGVGLSAESPAVGANQTELVKRLIAGGAAPNGLEDTIYNRNRELFDLLLKAGAPTNNDDIYACIMQDAPDMAKTLLEHGADPQPRNNNENRGNVYWAVSYDRTEILKLLLTYGADPTWKDRYGQTPLSLAKMGNNKEMVALLEPAVAKWTGADGKAGKAGDADKGGN